VSRSAATWIDAITRSGLQKHASWQKETWGSAGSGIADWIGVKLYRLIGHLEKKCLVLPLAAELISKGRKWALMPFIIRDGYKHDFLLESHKKGLQIVLSGLILVSVFQGPLHCLRTIFTESGRTDCEKTGWDPVR